MMYQPCFSIPAQCRDSLGMQSKEIPDHAITASSSYDDSTVGPKNARYVCLTNKTLTLKAPIITKADDNFDFFLFSDEKSSRRFT